MANWCNVRLVVAGRRADVFQFSRLARKRPSSLFQPDMLYGEGGDLFSEWAEVLASNCLKKVYKFQVPNGDGLEHFQGVSQQYPALCFVLVYADANSDEYGSYFISRGRATDYPLPERLRNAVMRKHGVTYDDDDEEWRF